MIIRVEFVVADDIEVEKFNEGLRFHLGLKDSIGGGSVEDRVSEEYFLESVADVMTFSFGM